MGQMILPLFVEGENNINDKVSYTYDKESDTIYYNLFTMPVYSHLKSDNRGFHIITSQLIINGHCRNCEIIKEFGVTAISVKRSVKKIRTEGLGGFFKEKATRTSPVLTADIIVKAQTLLDDNKSRREVSDELSIKINTLSKAIQAGKLQEHKKKLN